LSPEAFAGLLATTLALAVPLLLAALGEIVVEKAGIINVGIEGIMLTGALAAYAVAAASHSPWLGALASAGAGIVLALLFALLSLFFDADQVVVGTAINILAIGLTGVFYHALLGGLPQQPRPAAFTPVTLLPLTHLPIIGRALFDQNALAYFAFLMVPVVWVFLNKTRPGLALRAAGEHPAAADSAGFSVRRTRGLALIFGGAMAGLAGAYLSIAYTFGFAQQMSGGKGFIALAVVIVGRWSPVGALLAALLFGLASALQFFFQAINTPIPYQFFLALPYVLTLVALVVRVGRVAAPARLGEPYKRS
jgi:simple sugar transport system permease protein